VNVVDSSAWLEYFGDGPAAPEFARAVETPDELVVPALALFEVFKRMTQIRDDATALEAIGVMLQGRVVDLSATLVLEAARVSLDERPSLADDGALGGCRRVDAGRSLRGSRRCRVPGEERQAGSGG
jgi:hypothetical protein